MNIILRILNLTLAISIITNIILYKRKKDNNYLKSYEEMWEKKIKADKEIEEKINNGRL